MSATDGSLHGSVQLVDHGDGAQRFTITIVGDGYRYRSPQDSELAKYATDVDAFVTLLRRTPPFDELWCAINVHRVDVGSTDSGVDDAAVVPPTVSTYFDSHFEATDPTHRLLLANEDLAESVAHAAVPDTDLVLVIANTSAYGGSGGKKAAVFSAHPDSAFIGLHELGHSAFDLADEYPAMDGCDSGEAGHDVAPVGEPSEPNVTANTDAATIKWRTLLTNPADPLPTTANADCTRCDSQANPRPAGYVGAYEGARYFHCKYYRPQFDCRMRNDVRHPFCAVCQQAIRDALSGHMPAESIVLTTPSLAFGDVHEGVGGVGVTVYRQIVFELVTCGKRTFRIDAAPTGGFGVPLGNVVVATTSPSAPISEARLTISYTSTTAGTTSSGAVTVRCVETGQTWTVQLTGHTIQRLPSAVALVLDHSGSMAEDAGGGVPKVTKLREAATIFVDAMLDGDGLAIVRFDDTAQTLMDVTDVGPPTTGAGRAAALAQIAGPGLDPAGATSIGAGVAKGKAALDAGQAAANPPYAVTAMLVLTDGMENTAPLLATVGGSLTANTFAIGLGRPENISVAALSAIAQGHNGYLVVTGPLTPDQSARLNKRFLQVLAGFTNASPVLDPHGELTPGATHRIPFMLSETDYGVDVFLLCSRPRAVEFSLETPDGRRLDASSPVTGTFVSADGVAYYRLALPALPSGSEGAHRGLWHAVVRLADAQDSAQHELDSSIFAPAARGGTPYDVVVHAYSSLVLRADVQQASHEPGAEVRLTATLREYDLAVERRATVWVDVERPDGTSTRLALPETEAGRFETAFVAGLPGLYTLRIRALGATFAGSGFQREQTLSAAVTPGADRPPTLVGGRWRRCCRRCRLLRWLRRHL